MFPFHCLRRRSGLSSSSLSDFFFTQEFDDVSPVFFPVMIDYDVEGVTFVVGVAVDFYSIFNQKFDDVVQIFVAVIAT